MTMTTKDRALSYFDRVRARDAAGLALMFADDGRLILPNGTVRIGRSEVRETYDAIFAGAPATPQVTATITQGNSCSVEIDAHFESGKITETVDIFDFDNAGLITRLSIYIRG